MTIATILSRMQVLDNELDTASGGADETRAISALDMAQDAFEIYIANHPDLLGTAANTTTTADTETTTWPTGLMRIDTMWKMDTAASPNVPEYEIDVIQDVGGHRASVTWPWGFTGSNLSRGAPRGCYTNRAALYWSPLPDATYTVRIYGLYAKTDLASRAATFEYPDQVSLPMAAFAVRCMKIGVADPADALQGLADELYAPTLNMLRQPTRQRAQSRQYSQVHTT